MGNNTKRTHTKRIQPKKCNQTICGLTCIKTGYTCHDNAPNAKKKIRQRGKELVDRIQGKTNPKTKDDRPVEKSRAKNRSQGKLAYEQLTKDSKVGAKRAKSEAYNQGLKILAKYGGKDDSRTKVDRAVEKASAKTRRKPQTENEKTAKVLRREEAQRVLRELQDVPKSEKVRSNKSVDTSLKPSNKEETKKTLPPPISNQIFNEYVTSSSNTKIIKPTELIGEGSYGKVYLDRENNVVQKKLMSGSFSSAELKVSFIMGEMGFSPKVYPYQSNSKKLTMDLVSGRTLPDRDGVKYTLEQSEKILDGLIYLQRKVKYCHGDIHSGNILVHRDEAKIIDYGFTQPVKENLDRSLKDFEDIYDYLPVEELKRDSKYREIVTLAERFIEYTEPNSKDTKKSIMQDYERWLTEE
ncbi:MAG: AarF/UbiB family protein [Waterburya sp.]